MNTEKINAELKLLELVLSPEYKVLSEVNISNGVYYFISPTSRSQKGVRLFTSKCKKEVLDYEFNNVSRAYDVSDIRCITANPNNFKRLPSFTEVLPTLISCVYTPDIEDLFNINTPEVEGSETIYIRGRVKVATNYPEDVEDELDTIHSSAERTQEYIDSLELIRDEWETVATNLHSIIADHLSQEESTKEDLQYDLDQITFHHLLKKENTSDK